jgi:hypothetical protein
MGVAKDVKSRREATFALIEEGADAFFEQKSKMERELIIGRSTWAGIVRSHGFDPGAWAEIERVLRAVGLNLAKRTKQASVKFWTVCDVKSVTL